jgi:nondiscriminating aspartyl-tRNA synthetase
MRPSDLGSWRRTHFTSQITAELEGREVVVMGYVGAVRDLGGLKFLTLHDREGFLQVTAPKARVSEEVFEEMGRLSPQSCVAVRGKVVLARQAPGGVEIVPSELKLLNPSLSPLPLEPTGKIKSNLDTRLDSRLLDLRHPRQLALFRIKHEIVGIVREFLAGRGFLEVQTPKIVATATESGAALFPVTYFEKEAFLSQSPQLYKEVLTGCLDRVFEIGPIFRAEEHDTPRHLNETTSIDLEAAFVTQAEVMGILEEMVVEIFSRIKERCGRELRTLERELEIPEKPFPRLTYEEALRRLEASGLRVRWGEDLSTPAEKKLGELMKGPYFITDWPTSLKPFYILPKQGREEICEAFDLMYGELELASGGTRIHREELLARRLREKGLKPESFESHLRNFRYGMPPHAGFGLGLDRLTMAITGVSNIREVVLFPRDRKRLTP